MRAQFRQRPVLLAALAAGGTAGPLAGPEGPGRLARGTAAGAFAAMVPAFGLHVVIALAAAWLARGSRAAAAAACLLVGNPLTHAATLPVAYELGHRLLCPAVLGPGRLPPWLGALLPVAKEALAGGALLGVAAGAVAYAVARRALRAARCAYGRLSSGREDGRGSFIRRRG